MGSIPGWGSERLHMLPVVAKKGKQQQQTEIKKKKWLFGRRLGIFYRKFARLG